MLKIWVIVLILSTILNLDIVLTYKITTVIRIPLVNVEYMYVLSAYIYNHCVHLCCYLHVKGF